MIAQDTLAATAAGETTEALISWESRSCDELRAIASRGAHCGEIYFAAVKELERRAHDSELALEAEQTPVVSRVRELLLAAAIMLAAVVAATVLWLIGY